MARTAFRLGSALVLIGAIESPSFGQAFTRIVSFGDSLTDVGNTSSITFGVSPGSNYYNGRYSNGPVWVEDLAGDLNVSVPTRSRSGGFDYAVGGSRTGSGNVTPFPFINLPNAGTQIESFLGGNTPGANDLVTLWTGANDFFDGQTDPNVPATNVRAHVQRLVNAGVKNLLVVNLPPLGETPRYRTTADRATMNSRTLQFNLALASALDSIAAASPTVTLYRGDVYGMFLSSLSNPAAYGFTNITDTALRSDNTVVPNPDEHLFYDNVHPTRAGHDAVANFLFDVVETRSWNTTNTSGDWSIATNWTQRRTPDPTSAVVLTAATPFEVTLNGNATVRRLTVGSVPGGSPTTVPPSTLHLTGGTVTAGSTLVTRGGTLAGRGTLSSNLTLDTGGTISPGESNTVGQLNVLGALNFAGGVARFDLADVVSDRIAVTGAATLAGQIAVRFVDGFVGLPGKETTLFSFASMTGTPTFGNETGYAGLRFTPIQTATTFAIRLDATDGDATLNGTVDFDDLLVLAQHYGNASGQTWLTGDFTADGGVSFDDLLSLAQHYGGAGVSDAAFEADWALAQSLVPEPAVLVAGLSLAFIRRRRDAAVCPGY